MLHLYRAMNLGLAATLIVIAACTSPLSEQISKVENGLLPVTVHNNVDQTASIAQRMVHYGVPGVGVAVFDSGELVWAKGYGKASLETDATVDENTLFQAASISKPISAAGALILVQQGRLSLKEDINESLSSWQIPTNGLDSENPVTLERLLNHSAGVTVHGFPGYERDATLASLEDILNGEEPANTPRIEVDIPVGSTWRYSGGGYTVVQKLVIDETGQPFPSFMANSVLGPMGMANSTFQQPLPPERLSDAASGHQPGLGIVTGAHNIYPEMAAAGLWATATDLALFALNLHKSLAEEPEGVLDPSLVSEMLTVRKGNHGLGFKMAGEQQSLRASHSGINHGFDSMLVFYPALGSGAVIMTNSNLSQGLIDEILASIAQAYSWPEYPTPEQRQTKPYADEQLQNYPGTYDLGDGSFVSVVREGDRLFMLIPELGSTEIFCSPEDDRLFVTGIAFPSFKLALAGSERTIEFVGP